MKFEHKVYTPKIIEIDRTFSHFAKSDVLVLLDFSLTVKAATLIFISGCGSAISSAKGREIRLYL